VGEKELMPSGGKKKEGKPIRSSWRCTARRKKSTYEHAFLERIVMPLRSRSFVSDHGKGLVPWATPVRSGLHNTRL